MICPKCKAENIDGSRYCYACSNEFIIDEKCNKEDKIKRSKQNIKNLIEYYCPSCGIRVFSKYSCGICKNPSKFAYNDYFSKVCEKYYSSIYYQCTGYNFEEVISDKGKAGEYMLEKTVHNLRYNNITNYKLLFNLCVPEPNGLFQEIDAVLIVGRNIFVYEIKNRSGEISCNNFNDNDWFQKYGREVYSFYNPIKQNEEHRVALTHYLTENSITNIGVIANVVTFATDSNIVACKQKVDASHLHMYPYLELNYTNCNYSHFLYPVIKMLYQEQFDIYYDTFKNITKGKGENDIEESCYVKASYFASAAFKSNNEDIYDALKKLTYIDSDKRKAYFNEREFRKEQTQKREYRYFYLGNDKTEDNTEELVINGLYCVITERADGLVVRTNNVYFQYKDGADKKWKDALKYSSQFDEVVWEGNKKTKDYKYKYELKSPMEIIKAHQCLEEGVIYKPDNTGIIEGIGE